MSIEVGRNKATNNLNINKLLSKHTTTKASNFPRICTERANLTVYQHNFINAFWGVHFSSHDKSGIHGACNFDMMHTILSGMLEKTRTEFFVQVGKDFKTATDLDALAK